ncbi:MAG: hypothetical protein ACK5X3_12960 [Pseudomonadota bacterium]|jgi:hypothetical protein
MIDLRGTIKPKSDQLNADDLIGGPITIRITGVMVGEGEQPVSISFDGDGGKPFKPGKSMRRVLVNLWGPDGAAYIGRSLTIYRDEQVVFGGVEVGGIRISHMSHLQRETTMALTATKAKRKPFTVRPLVVEKPADKAAIAVDALLARIAAGEDVTGDAKVAEQRAWLAKNRPELAEKIIAAIDHRREYAETQTQEAAQ